MDTHTTPTAVLRRELAKLAASITIQRRYMRDESAAARRRETKALRTSGRSAALAEVVRNNALAAGRHDHLERLCRRHDEIEAAIRARGEQ